MERKKLRGGRRRLRDLDRQRDAALDLDLDRLATELVVRFRLSLAPFHRFSRRAPPVSVQQRGLAALVAVHDAWARRLAGAGAPHHLSLRLHQPHFLLSEVVAAVAPAMASYDLAFAGHPGVAPAPPADLDAPGVQLASWTWAAHPQLDTETLEAGAREGPRARALRRRALARDVDASGAEHLTLRVGTLWVGRRGA
jgi:hypothetical protein